MMVVFSSCINLYQSFGVPKSICYTFWPLNSAAVSGPSVESSLSCCDAQVFLLRYVSGRLLLRVRFSFDICSLFLIPSP